MKLISYWPGENDAKDVISNNDAVWSGTPGTPAYTTGCVGECFDVVNTAYLTIPASSNFDFAPADAFSVQFYCKFSGISIKYVFVYNKDDNGGFRLYADGDGSFELGGPCFANTVSYKNATRWVSGIWVKIKISYNNGNWTLYLDGVLQTPDNPSYATGQYLGTGALTDVTIAFQSSEFLIDEIKIFNDNLNESEAYMSSTALNQVYKTAIVAVEECPLGADAAIGATTLTLAGTYMSAAPFVVGREYIIRDDSFTATSEGVPNAERIMVTSVANMTATPKSDGIGYAITGTIGVIGYAVTGFTGGLVNAYTMALHGSILTPGVEIAIQSADFNCRFKTLTDAPKIDFDDEASRFATGDEGRDTSIAGARSGEITFTEKLSWAGSVSTVPTWGKLMRTMGHVIKTYTTKGIGFIPHTWANETTATIWIVAPENGMNPTSTVYRYCGAHGGNGSSISVGKIGDVWMLTGKYSAAYIGTKEIAFSAARALTSPDSKVPEVMLSNSITVPTVFGHSCTPYSYATVAALVTAEVLTTGGYFYTADGTDTTDNALATAKGTAIIKGDVFKVASSSTCTYVTPVKTVEISQFSLDFGGVVNPFIDQSTSTGNAYYATQDRDPKFTCNPYHVRKEADDIDFVASQMITGTLTVASALSAPHLTLEIPNAQLLSPALASREGYVSTSRTYRCLRNNTGAGIKESALPAQASYELLIGARA